MSTEAAECESGEVRLANFTDDPDEATREGTMQICINSAWGTVCSDDLFDTTDAEVFCEQLEGFGREGEDRIIHLLFPRLHQFDYPSVSKFTL